MSNSIIVEGMVNKGLKIIDIIRERSEVINHMKENEILNFILYDISCFIVNTIATESTIQLSDRIERKILKSYMKLKTKYIELKEPTDCEIYRDALNELTFIRKLVQDL